METIYVVQGFESGKRGALVPLQAIAFPTETQARSRAERLAQTCDGVLAIAQAADIETGDYADPVILMSIGRVPEILGAIG